MDPHTEKKVLFRSLKFMILILDKFTGIDPKNLVPSKTDHKGVGKTLGNSISCSRTDQRFEDGKKMRVRKQTL